MRTALVGAVDSTRVALEALAEAGHPPVELFTLPPARGARRHSDYVDLAPAARRLGVRVTTAPDVNAPEVLGRLHELELDYLMVIGWSQICRRELLEVAGRGAIGYHPAALPENRGRAVIPWTILQGAAGTGSTLFWMDEGMDSGDILAQVRFAVDPDETAASLYAKHMDALRRMLLDVLPRLDRGDAPRTAQDHSQATYCAKRTADDGYIDWSRPAAEIEVLVRAVGPPYPGAFTFHRGRRLTLLRCAYVGDAPYWGMSGQIQRVDHAGALVQCGDRKHLLVRLVRPEGGESVHPQEIVRNHERLGMNWPDLCRPASMESDR